MDINYHVFEPSMFYDPNETPNKGYLCEICGCSERSATVGHVTEEQFEKLQHRS